MQTANRLFPRVQLGGKGANLCEMARCGLNVPPGLTVTTEVCQEFYKVGEQRDSRPTASSRAGLEARWFRSHAYAAPLLPLLILILF
jgi:hypothetical protein